MQLVEEHRIREARNSQIIGLWYSYRFTPAQIADLLGLPVRVVLAVIQAPNLGLESAQRIVPRHRLAR